MTECAGCGDCCENFPLNTPQRADVYGRRALAACMTRPEKMRDWSGADRKMAAWMANLIPTGEFRINNQTRWTYRCPIFDPVTRRCTDHANRPPVCSGYPHYGRLGPYKRYPTGGATGPGDLGPRCSFNADHRTMLPIVEVRHTG